MSTTVSRMGRVSSPCSRAARHTFPPVRRSAGKGSPGERCTSIPAMKVFNKGQVETTIIGAKPKFALEQDLAAYIA